MWRRSQATPSAEEGVPPPGSSSSSDQQPLPQEPEPQLELRKGALAAELERTQRLAAEAAAEAIASIRRC